MMHTHIPHTKRPGRQLTLRASTAGSRRGAPLQVAAQPTASPERRPQRPPPRVTAPATRPPTGAPTRTPHGPSDPAFRRVPGHQPITAAPAAGGAPPGGGQRRRPGSGEPPERGPKRWKNRAPAGTAVSLFDAALEHGAVQHCLYQAQRMLTALDQQEARGEQRRAETGCVAAESAASALGSNLGAAPPTAVPSTGSETGNGSVIGATSFSGTSPGSEHGALTGSTVSTGSTEKLTPWAGHLRESLVAASSGDPTLGSARGTIAALGAASTANTAIGPAAPAALTGSLTGTGTGASRAAAPAASAGSLTGTVTGASAGAKQYLLTALRGRHQRMLGVCLAAGQLGTALEYVQLLPLTPPLFTAFLKECVAHCTLREMRHVLEVSPLMLSATEIDGFETKTIFLSPTDPNSTFLGDEVCLVVDSEEDEARQRRSQSENGVLVQQIFHALHPKGSGAKGNPWLKILSPYSQSTVSSRPGCGCYSATELRHRARLPSSTLIQEYLIN